MSKIQNYKSRFKKLKVKFKVHKIKQILIQVKFSYWKANCNSFKGNVTRN